jgi:hypothetical protein
MEEVVEDRRKFHTLYSSTNIIRKMKSRRMRNIYRNLIGKPEGRKIIGRPKP